MWPPPVMIGFYNWLFHISIPLEGFCYLSPQALVLICSHAPKHPASTTNRGTNDCLNAPRLTSTDRNVLKTQKPKTKKQDVQRRTQTQYLVIFHGVNRDWVPYPQQQQVLEGSLGYVGNPLE